MPEAKVTAPGYCAAYCAINCAIHCTTIPSAISRSILQTAAATPLTCPRSEPGPVGAEGHAVHRAGGALTRGSVLDDRIACAHHRRPAPAPAAVTRLWLLGIAWGPGMVMVAGVLPAYWYCKQNGVY